MRIIKIILLIALILCLVLAVGIYLFIKSFDISRYQDRITEEISRQVDREVSLEKISLEADLKRGITLVIHGFRISDDPDFSSAAFLKADKILLAVNPFIYLQQRRLSIPRIEILSPDIRIIRDANGRLNIPQAGPAPSKSLPVTSDITQTREPGSSLGAQTLAWAVDSFQIQHGSIAWIDRQQEQEISVLNTEVGINNFAPNKIFSFQLETAGFADEPNIRLEGRARYDTGSGLIEINDTKVELDLDSISLDRILSTFPAVKAAGLKAPLSGQILASIKRLTAGPQGISDLVLGGRLSNGGIGLIAIPAPFKGVQADFNINDGQMTVSNLTASLSSGTMTGRADLGDFLKQPKTRLQLSLSGLPAEAVLPPLDSQARLKGQIQGKADLSFKGLVPNEILRSLSGPIELGINNGMLENLNVLRTVLERISMVPNLVEKIYANLPEKYQQQLENEDTVFTKIEIRMRGQDQGLAIQDLDVVADAFALSARGHLDPDLDLDLEAQLSIPQDLSLSMLQSVEELEYILDRNGQIMIPLKYRGPVRSMRFLPDLNYLSKRILINRGAQELDKLLDKVFDREEGQAASEENPSPQQPQTQSPERELIEGLLESILK